MTRFRIAFFTVLAPLVPLVLAQECFQYGSPQSGSSDACLCPAGFNPPSGGNGTCSLPVCGGSLYEPGEAAPGGSGGLGDVSSGCGCTGGWGGPSCTVCQTADACTVSLNRYLNSSNALGTPGLDTTMTCSASPFVYSSSHLSCSVQQSTVQALFPGETTLTITRTLNASLTPGGDATLTAAGLLGGEGIAYAQLWLDGIEQFYCRASGCAQSTEGGNGSTWDCPSLNCTCRPGAAFCGGGQPIQNLASIINDLDGPLSVECQGSTCFFKQNLLVTLFGNEGLSLSSCTHGECVQQYVIDQAQGESGVAASSDEPALGGGVIAGLAVVGAILLAIIALVVWGLIKRKRARADMRTDGVLPKSGGVGVTWSGVGYEVKPHAGGTRAKTAVWLRGSGSRHQASEGGEAVGPNGGKIVLRDVHGQLPPGGFCAILGPSGAGKSTLVDVLAGKRKAGKVEGRVGFARRDGQQGRVKIGYVDQSDVLSPTSTVLETLIFAAHLRLPENIPKAVKEERAHTVLGQLGLTDVAHTRVGSVERRGISGGEMRRVSIGIELVAAPDVLVLDEPTSGLDSVSAARLVKLLKSLAEDQESQTTIIASIHQPSSALYHSFSQVVLLSNGRQLYFGPGGSRPAEFFASQGRPCPPGYNVADHLLEIASGSNEGLATGQGAIIVPQSSSVSSSSPGTGTGRGTPEENGNTSKTGSDRRLVDDNGAETPFQEKNMSYPPTAPALLKDERREVDLAELSDEETKREWWPRTHCATTFLTQMEVLSGREWQNLKRDKTLLIAHVGLACILGVFAGGLYYQVGVTIAGFQNRVGSLFFLGSLIAFSSLSALYNLVEVRGLFLRERAGSFYSSQAWLLSRVLFDVIPLRLVPTILVGVIVYFMVGLATDASRFFKFLLIIVEFSIAMVLFNFLLACVFRHGGIAILLSSLCNLFLMTYAGFFVNIEQIPPVLRWLRYFSTLGYTLEALSINEVGSGLQIVDNLAGVNVEINAVLIMQTLFGFNLGNYYRDVLVLFAFIAGHGILLVLTVVYFLRESR